MKWNISLNYSCDLLLSSFLSTKLYPSSDCVLSSVPLNLTSSLQITALTEVGIQVHYLSFQNEIVYKCLPTPNNLHESVLFHLQRWRRQWRCVHAGAALSQRLKDSRQSKKFTNSVSGGLWATQADINWYVYAWLAAASITTLFNNTLSAFKNKSLVRMLSYLKQFLWFYSSAIFFFQQFIKTVWLKLQKH